MNILFVVPENSIKGRIVLENILSKYEQNKDIHIGVWFNNIDAVGDIQRICETKKIPFRKISDLNLKKEAVFAENFDLCIVCGWGWIVSRDFIDQSNNILNCHSSYLPDYKGASVYFHQWANCETIGGATIHYLVDKIDLGDIVEQGTFEISIKDSPQDILMKASHLTAQLIGHVIDDYVELRVINTTIKQHGGRYFLKTPYWKLRIYRLINAIFYRLNLALRIYTPHKWM